MIFYKFKRRNERFSFHQSLDKRNANGNKTEDKKKKHKNKMLGGQGRLIGPQTSCWRQHTSPELHLPFSNSQASGLRGQRFVGGIMGGH